MEVWTFPGFESDSIACKNSFNSSFHLLQSLEKFSWSNVSDFGAGELVSLKKRETKCKIRQIQRKETKF